MKYKVQTISVVRKVDVRSVSTTVKVMLHSDRFLLTTKTEN